MSSRALKKLYGKSDLDLLTARLNEEENDDVEEEEDVNDEIDVEEDEDVNVDHERFNGWDEFTEDYHINAKELLAVILAIEADITPPHSSIALSTDNTVTFFCIRNQGSNRSHLLQELTE